MNQSLNSQWDFWFSHRGKKSSENNESDYKNNLKSIGNAYDLESFWEIF